MADEMTPSQQAAAFHGLATNLAYPPDERLRLALKALDLYEAEVERLRELLGSVAWDDVRACVEAAATDLTEPERYLADYAAALVALDAFLAATEADRG